METWEKDLKYMVGFMRDLSRETDPQKAANLYGRGLRQAGLFPTDGYLSVSRRDLQYPAYRITRSSTWTESIDPWKEKHRLPIYTGGLISDLIYSNEPTVIENLQSKISHDDPAAEYFRGMNLLFSVPHFDDGEGLNMGIMLLRDGGKLPREMLATVLLQANLWGRSVLNFVLRQELKKNVDALDRELKAVGEIQRTLLPRMLPKISGLELAAHYETSQRAGGDYYDFLPLPDGRWGILIADVSGHGTPAAVMMAITQAITHTRPIPAMAPGALLGYLNNTLETRYLGQTGSFVTAFYGIFEPETRRFTYSSAGHPAPRLARGRNVVGLGKPSGIPLGIDPVDEYSQEETRLEPGDRLLFYTDGVSEAFNPAHSQFGTEGLDAAIQKTSGNAESLLNTVLTDLREHCGDVSVADDRTLLAGMVSK